MSAQITFLERCKSLGIADKNLPAWLEEIEAIVQQAGEVMREQSIKKWETCSASEDWNFGYTIRGLPGVTLKDLK